MAHIVIPYLVMAYMVMAPHCIRPYRPVAYIVMARTVMAHIAMAYIVMAYITYLWPIELWPRIVSGLLDLWRLPLGITNFSTPVCTHVYTNTTTHVYCIEFNAYMAYIYRLACAVTHMSVCL